MKTSSMYILDSFKKEWIMNVCLNLLADVSDNDAEITAGRLTWLGILGSQNHQHRAQNVWLTSRLKYWTTFNYMAAQCLHRPEESIVSPVHRTQGKSRPRTSNANLHVRVCRFHFGQYTHTYLIIVIHQLIWPSAAKLELFYTVTLIFSVFYSFTS